MVVLDAISVRLAAGTASDTLTFQEDMPGQVSRNKFMWPVQQAESPLIPEHSQLCKPFVTLAEVMQ